MISISHLDKHLAGRELYDDLNLDVRPGEILVILGRSGSGKSVLLKHILGIMRADSGSIKVDGVCVSSASEAQLMVLRQKIGMVFQGGALFDSMTIADNVSFALEQHSDLSYEQRRELAAEKLALVDLEGTLDMRPAELSGGMKKRAAIARAIAIDPQLILYDEPTTGLDPVTADVINDLILKLHQQVKGTTIVVTHDMQSAFKLADRMAMLHDGKIIQVDTPENMKASQLPVVQEFLGGQK